MTYARNGDTVKVHYTGKLQDGTEFDSSSHQEPLEFTLGAGEVIPGFEQAVLGMSPGETKTATVTAGDAYGQYEEDLVLEIDRSDFPPEISPEVGQRLRVRQPDGEAFAAVVTEVGDDSVTLDANHPLAGQELTFEIHLVDVDQMPHRDGAGPESA